MYKDDTDDELFADSERNDSNIDASSASQVSSETTTATRSSSILSDAFSETDNNASVIPQPSSSPSTPVSTMISDSYRYVTTHSILTQCRLKFY